MNQFEKDLKLEQLLKNYVPDSPEPDFQDRVMKGIFREQYAPEQLKKYPVLGRSFWIFLLLFAILISFVVIFASISGASSGESAITAAGINKISEGYHSFLSQIGTLPMSIATILTATSLLILLGGVLDKNIIRR